MKKIKKKYIFIIIGILIGLVISVGRVYASVTITGSTVTYSNSLSGLSSSTVQAAIDELNKKTDIRTLGNYVAAYKYSTATSTKCITGEESTCVKTTCYKTKTNGSCPAGTIIKYKVNDTDIVNFHVMFDNGTTITMQSQKNTLYNTYWSNDANIDGGPLPTLSILEKVTAGWTNVNNQTYTMGTTVFKTNAYTGCSDYNNCTTNVYTWTSRTAKARMITVQEAAALGCTATVTSSSCPIWMYNYLNNSTSSGGTVDDNAKVNNSNYSNRGYWTMSAVKAINFVYAITWGGYLSSIELPNFNYNNGARAVVVVSK